MSGEDKTFPTEQQFDDQELFDDAEATETPENPVAAAAETEQEKPEPVAAEAATTETTAERPAVDDNAPLVPSWRLREINEEKRALAEKVASFEAQLAQLRNSPQNQRELEQQQKRDAPPAKPDPLLDPEGYAASIREEVRQEALAERREESLLRAREANQKDFDEAYAAARQAVDPALKARMQSSRDPGKTLLEWHRENKVRAEVGSDPNAWLEKKMEERLKDPAFLAKAVELARGTAQPLTNGRPNVSLPPSLNGASRSNASLSSSTVGNDLSDEGLWEYSNS